MVTDIKNVGNIGGGGQVGAVDKNANTPRTPGGFGTEFTGILKSKVIDAKKEALASEAGGSGIKFSQHAIERMTSRGINFKPEELLKLSDAVEKAAQKGSRESLVLMGDSALIVSVKNKTVITAMDKEAMKENVFTNIDSTVIL